MTMRLGKGSSESPRASSEGFALLDQATIEVLRSETLSSVGVGEAGEAGAGADEGEVGFGKGLAVVDWTGRTAFAFVFFFFFLVALGFILVLFSASLSISARFISAHTSLTSDMLGLAGFLVAVGVRSCSAPFNYAT